MAVEHHSHPYPYPPTAPFKKSLKTPEFGSFELAASFDAATGRNAALDNRGATFPGGEAQEAWRPRNAPRWRLKAQIVDLLRPDDGARGPAVCGCGRPGHEVEVVTLHRRESGAAGVGGVFRCDSPWLCPSCAPGRAARRKERLEQVIAATEARGGDCAFVTLTVQHNRSMSLASLKAAVSAASRAARQGRAWVQIQCEGGLIGVVQGVELLWNRRTGWHYHLHLLIPSRLIGDPVIAACEALVERYIAALKKGGFYAKRVGQDVKIVWNQEASEYASKGSAAWEVAGGLKEARAAISLTPWQLAQLAAAGDVEAKALFLEYADQMPGTRSCVVSAALADALELAPADDDDAPGDDQDLSESGELLGSVGAAIWGRVVSRRKAYEVFEAIERGDPWSALEPLVNLLGAPPPTPPPPERVIDLDRFAIDAVRWRSVGHSVSQCLDQMKSDVESLKRSHERAGYVVRLDRGQLDRAFLKAALENG